MRLPAIFFGHGNPMNAVQSNSYTAAWRRLGEETPRPRGILMVSAHWYGPGSAVTAMAAPRTIHDFGGFPRALYEMRYPASGDPVLAHRIRDLLAPLPVALDESWGFDHGTWSVLLHAYPKADVPVIQLALDETQPASFHLSLGRRLAPLREEGVLVAGSGNLVHNLHAYAWGRHQPASYDWARRFEAQAKALMLAGEDEALAEYESLGRDAALSVPTPEHFLPLLYVLGTRQPGEAVDFPVEGVDGGSISMLSVRVGGANSCR